MKKWEILSDKKVKKEDEIIEVLLRNRNIKQGSEEKEFFSPTNPSKISLESLGVNSKQIQKAVDRIKKAKKNNENVVVYGDYDADGITATAIMWETLHSFGLNVLPFIPDRFADGYGIKADTVKKLKERDGKLSLIITVDNGIVGYEGVNKAKELGVDVVVVDHHTKGDKELNAYSVIHSTIASGSGLSWFFSQKICPIPGTLELAAIGTLADQLPLVGVNRSIVKYGLSDLNITRRPGLLALFKEAGIEEIGTYEIGYVIAPRINAMGRLKNGLESLRLLCTKDKSKAIEIAKNVGSTNLERQKIVEEVITLARKNVTNQKVIVIAGDDYHEGVIGLAAGRLVEEFYRPAIVISKNGKIAKASARSVSGFNIIEAIRSVSLHTEGGGHPMAAGFSIEVTNIEKFTIEINKFADSVLTDEVLERKVKIDLEIPFESISYHLCDRLKDFEPTGLGNPGATFVSKQVEILSVKPVGKEARHLKMKLKQDEHVFDSIFFGGGEIYSDVPVNSKIDVVYNLEENIWNGNRSLQLKVKDLRS